MKNYCLTVEARNDIMKFTVSEPDKLDQLRHPVLMVIVGILTYLIPKQSWRMDHHMSIIIGLVLIGILALCRQQRQDVLVVMKGIGVQLNSRSNWKFVNKSDKNVFIPLTNIIDLVIHEGFHGYGQVIFYMCVLTKNTKDNDMIKVVFSELLPRKDILVQVWKQSRNVLFNGNRYWRRIPGQGLKPVI